MPRLALFTAILTLAIALMSSALSAQTRGASQGGAYEKLSDNNRRIVSAIYEAQLGSRSDTAGRKLLTRDEIAVLRRKTDWASAYRRLYERGMVKDRSLDQAIRNQSRGTVAGGGLTVITTADGEQLIYGTKRAISNPTRSARSTGAPTTTTKVEQGKPAIVTNAATTAGANGAEATSTAAGASLAVGGD